MPLPHPPSRASGAAADFGTDADGDDVPIPCGVLEQAEEAYRLFDTQTTGKAVILPS